MKTKRDLAGLFQLLPFISGQVTPKLLLAMLLSLSGLGLQAQNAPRGESIGPIAGTNAAALPSVIQTVSNAVSVTRTNAAGEYLVGFDTLSSYSMNLPDNLLSNTNQPGWADAQVNAMIPPAVRAYNGKKVRIEGFMLPTTWGARGKVTSFLLMKNQISCCYGGPSQIHEFVTIRVQGKGVGANMDSTITAGGVLHVGAVRENGQLVGIYRLETQDLVVPPSD